MGTVHIGVISDDPGLVDPRLDEAQWLTIDGLRNPGIEYEFDGDAVRTLD